MINFFDWVKYATKAAVILLLAHSLTCLTSSVLLAQRADIATDAANGPNSSNIQNRQNNPYNNREKINNFIQTVQGELSQKKVIAASLSQSFTILGQAFQGTGAYLEKNENNNRSLRMEINYASGDARFDLLYVSDGRKFWMAKDAGAGRLVTFIDLFLLQPQEMRNDNAFIKNDVSSSALSLSNPQIAIGGLSQLLAQIFRYFDFTEFTESTNDQNETQSYKIGGTWKPETFPFPENVKQGIIDWENITEDIPDKLEIVFGASDLFPYQIIYTRKRQKDIIPISLIQFTDVSFSTRISPVQFNFDPPAETTPIDMTPQFRLRQAAMRQDNTPNANQNNSNPADPYKGANP